MEASEAIQKELLKVVRAALRLELTETEVRRIFEQQVVTVFRG
jgi:hypothetical protein